MLRSNYTLVGIPETRPQALVGPYKTRKTGTRDPSGTLVGPYKNRKNGTRDPSETCGTLQKPKNKNMGVNVVVWVNCKCMELVAAGSCTRK